MAAWSELALLLVVKEELCENIGLCTLFPLPGPNVLAGTPDRSGRNLSCGALRWSINQTAESNDRFGTELGVKFLDRFFDDAIVLVFITAKFFFTAGLLE